MESDQENSIHFFDYWRVVRTRLGLVIFIFLSVVFSAGVATYFAPRQYHSFATIEVQADMTPVHMLENQREPATLDDAKFSLTQIQIILRKGVLYPVIERLNLQARWAQNGK